MQEVQQSLSLVARPFHAVVRSERLGAPGAACWRLWGPGAAGRVHRGRDHYVVEAASPGLDSEAIEIEMVQGTLTMRGTYPEAMMEGRHYLMQQWPRGQFQTAVTLPDVGDGSQVSASYEQGRLRLTVPKSEAAKPKRIMLKAGV
jgi:HSP20 family protein